MIIKNGRFGTIKIKVLLYEADEYEIYKTLSNATLLIVRQSLYNKWTSDKLFFAINPFSVMNYDGTDFAYTASKDFMLIPVKDGNPICNHDEATSFAFAIKQMRKVTELSLFDGIYIEEYGYLLPTYSNEYVSDDATIGCFLSGGKNIHFSDNNFKTFLLDESTYSDIERITGIKRKVLCPQEKNAKVVCQSKEFHLAGRPDLEKFFNDHIINVLAEPERYKRLGIDFPSSIILYGPPGCGKTYAVDKLVEFLGLPRYDVNSSTIASPYIHDTARKVADIFQNAINSAPSIVVIDEMESYLSNRESASSNSQHFEEVAEFLRQIQEAQKNKVLIIAMTNMYEKIDPAIIRRGRFDHHIEVGLPSIGEIEALLENITKNLSLSNEISLTAVAEDLSGKTLADVAFVIKEAGLISGKNGFSEITLESVKTAIDTLPKEHNQRRIGFGTN